MAGLRARGRWAIPFAVLLLVGTATGVWALNRDDEVRRADLEDMQPEAVGRPPTIEWPKRLTCRGEDAPLCGPEDAGETGDIVYLKETINLDEQSPGLLDLLRLFLEDGFDHVVVCPPAASRGIARCAAVAGIFDVPAENAVYVG